MASRRHLTRRDFVKWGAVAAAGAGLSPIVANNLLAPTAANAFDPSDPRPDLEFAGTDGWIYLPRTPAIPPFHPDVYAPDPFTTYVFGFHNVTGLTATQIANQKNKAQHTAPMFWLKAGQEFRVRLYNVGLAQRPDLFDAHTLHFHGFRDVIPFFDGEPTRIGGGARPQRLHLRVPTEGSRHLHVPLPRGGHRARPDGHDRARVHPSRQQRQHGVRDQRDAVQP